MNDRFLHYWKGDSAQRKGYRKLAEWFNITILRREMDRVGISTLGDEAKAKYERLEGDDETTAAEVREMVSSAGVDMDQLEHDFVSYAVIRTHLKKCLDAKREKKDNKWEQKALQITREHSKDKAADAVRSLINKGEIKAGGDVDLHVDFRIECEECNTRVPLDRAIEREKVCECVTKDKEVMQ